MSAAVGSGKTRAACRYIADDANASRNFLYVAPSIALGEQTAAGLQAALDLQPSGHSRSVRVINSNTDGGKTRAAALAAINETPEGAGHCIILTTQTLLDILAGIGRPDDWSVILDEAFSPATFERFSLGADAREGWDYFSSVFRVDPSQGHRILPQEGRRSLVSDLADGRLTQAGGKYEGLAKVAKAVSNPASRCELVVTDQARALLEGQEPPPKRKEAAESVLEFASYISPEYFAGFREVLFLSALFEQTILYALWTKALGVTFQRHPSFPVDLLRDTHADQGRYLAVGHLLHEKDTSSKENLGRSALTGQPGERQLGRRVLDQAVKAAADYFGEAPFLLQTNNGQGYEPGSLLMPPHAVHLRPLSHGLNCYQDFNNVVSLCVVNPTPQQLAWVKERTGMTSAQVTQCWRIHSVYQALGRCSIRKAAPTTDTKTVLVTGARDAHFLHDLFPGSTWLGQVGDLPPLRSLLLTTETKELGKAEALAVDILHYLDTLEGTDRISSRALKALITNLQTRTNREENVRRLEEFSSDTWTRAVGMACVPGSGWIKQGHKLVRSTAELYGFETQTS